jgi:hypothetical protein
MLLLYCTYTYGTIQWQQQSCFISFFRIHRLFKTQVVSWVACVYGFQQQLDFFQEAALPVRYYFSIKQVSISLDFSIADAGVVWNRRGDSWKKWCCTMVTYNTRIRFARIYVVYMRCEGNSRVGIFVDQIWRRKHKEWKEMKWKDQFKSNFIHYANRLCFLRNVRKQFFGIIRFRTFRTKHKWFA